MATVSYSYDSVTSSNAITITLASLASSTTAGRQSTIIDNSSNLYVDFILSGQITTGTSPTGGSIKVFVFGPTEFTSSTFSYPFATATEMAEADAARTIEAEQQGGLALVQAIAVNTTSDRSYAIRPVSVASLFGGVVPVKWGAWVVHNTGVNLNSTAANQFLHWSGIKYTSA